MKLNQLHNFITAKLSSELSSQLTYHGVHHTLEVLQNCRQYIERLKLPESESKLLQTAALMHDTGFLFTYKDHETESKRYAKEILPDWGYSDGQITKICNMIEATRIPQQPASLSEKILADSDLDYLGTEGFYKISETLFLELVAFDLIDNRDEWDQLQIRFLEKHYYHTDYARDFREPVKQEHLRKLKENQNSR